MNAVAEKAGCSRFYCPDRLYSTKFYNAARMAEFDVITMGRSGIDLYAEQVGVPFEEVRTFAAYVGGSPANIAVGTRRLGLLTAILTAVSDDPVGDFITRFLRDEGIDVAYIPRIPGVKSGAVLASIEPPDRFTVVHYRKDCADLRLDRAAVRRTPIHTARMLVVVGTNLSAEPSRDATLFAAETARAHGVPVLFDLDFRPDQWTSREAFAHAVDALLPLAGIVIGTEAEICAAVAGTPGAHDPPANLLARGPNVVVEKRGADGSCVHRADGDRVDVPPFRVAVQNTLGAGDAFAAGFIYGHLEGWDWRRAARLGNACGAMVVSRHGCSAACPTYEEVVSFADRQGGL